MAKKPNNTNNINNEEKKHSIGFKTSGKAQTVKPKSAAEREALELLEVKANRKKWHILCAAVVAAAVVVGILVGVLVAILGQEPDLSKVDLSKYIHISEDDYKNYTLDVPTDSVKDGDLERRINILLCSHKGDQLYDGAFMRGKALTVGALAYIWYRGYTVEDGVEHDFAGSSNFSSDSQTVLEVGSGNIYKDGAVSGQFIPGFADALIGKVPNAYPKFDRITSGTVAEGDVVYLTYSVIRPDGTYDSYTAQRIDLSSEALDEELGDGFAELLLGKNIGEKLTFKDDKGEDQPEVRVKWRDKGDAIYYDVSVDYVTRFETEDKLTIDVTFPADYSEQSLRGVDAKFDVYIDYALFYEMPEYNAEFIKDKLKISEDSLMLYEGADIVAKHNAKLLSEIEKDVEESNRTVLEEAMWKHYKSKVEIKKLPKKTVKTYYESFYQEIEDAYASYTEKYDTLDKFAIAYLGLSSNADWREHILNQAKDVTLEKLLFYYIMRAENLYPSDAEYNKRYQEIYTEYLNYYLELNKADFEKLEGEEYEKELDILKKEIDNYYGEEYFKESVYYDYAVEIMISYASLTK